MSSYHPLFQAFASLDFNDFPYSAATTAKYRRIGKTEKFTCMGWGTFKKHAKRFPISPKRPGSKFSESWNTAVKT